MQDYEKTVVWLLGAITLILFIYIAYQIIWRKSKIKLDSYRFFAVL
jgi:hypothetical protein